MCLFFQTSLWRRLEDLVHRLIEKWSVFFGRDNIQWLIRSTCIVSQNGPYLLYYSTLPLFYPPFCPSNSHTVPSATWLKGGRLVLFVSLSRTLEHCKMSSALLFFSPRYYDLGYRAFTGCQTCYVVQCTDIPWYYFNLFHVAAVAVLPVRETAQCSFKERFLLRSCGRSPKRLLWLTFSLSLCLSSPPLCASC